MLVRRSINLLLDKNSYKILLSKHHLWNWSINPSFLQNKLIKSIQIISRMGSSSSRSFSPIKAAADAEVTPPKKFSNPADEFVEAVICHENDLAENEMKSYDLGEGKILLVKQKGIITAMGSKCTHYGAPLASGALGDGRVRCPWHGACFNTKTGDIEDYPGLDGVPSFYVTIDDEGAVKVRAKKTELESSRRIKPMVMRITNKTETAVIIGGGPSAESCAEKLRQHVFTGRLVIISKENHLPYDRVKLSKGFDTPFDKLQIRNLEFFQKFNIEFMRGISAQKLNPAKKCVYLSNGTNLHYTKIYIASGMRPRVPDIPGIKLANIFTLRTYDDAQNILYELGPTKRMVVVGTSFIGMEVSAYCVNKVSKLTVIGRDLPMRNVFGEAIGARIKEMFEEKGVQFELDHGVKRFLGNNDRVTEVELINGTKLPVDVVVIGIGAVPNTEFLKDSGITLRKDGSIPVNTYLETSMSKVFAGGDVAYAPVFGSLNNESAVIGHFGLAQYHGRIAAQNMLGEEVEAKSVPFFWTMLFGKSIRYAGYGKPDDVKIEGDLKGMKFVAFYFKDNKVCAVASCQRDPICAQFAETLNQGRQLRKNEILANPFGWLN